LDVSEFPYALAPPEFCILDLDFALVLARKIASVTSNTFLKMVDSKWRFLISDFLFLWEFDEQEIETGSAPGFALKSLAELATVSAVSFLEGSNYQAPVWEIQFSPWVKIQDSVSL
jgi:hypothetical protein